MSRSVSLYLLKVFKHVSQKTQAYRSNAKQQQSREKKTVQFNHFTIRGIFAELT